MFYNYIFAFLGIDIYPDRVYNKNTPLGYKEVAAYGRM